MLRNIPSSQKEDGHRPLVTNQWYIPDILKPKGFNRFRIPKKFKKYLNPLQPLF
jgi:hypothetical protein